MIISGFYCPSRAQSKDKRAKVMGELKNLLIVKVAIMPINR